MKTIAARPLVPHWECRVWASPNLVVRIEAQPAPDRETARRLAAQQMPARVEQVTVRYLSNR